LIFGTETDYYLSHIESVPVLSCLCPVLSQLPMPGQDRGSVPVSPKVNLSCLCPVFQSRDRTGQRQRQGQRQGGTGQASKGQENTGILVRELGRGEGTTVAGDMAATTFLNNLMVGEL
jgi:hypothetical protein